jgi:hypothetical protein
VVLEILATQRRCLYGDHEILVQKTSLIHRMQYGLIIDGRKQDQIDALAGTFSLHGVITEDKSVIPVSIVIKQGFFTGTYHCVINGRTRRMDRYRHEIP